MIQYATYSSPFGALEIGCDENKVVCIRKSSMTSHEPSALSDQVNEQLQEYFSGVRKTFDFPILLGGTPFQQAVWNALRNIPYGEVRSYKQIAESIGHPNACRAVGQAIHRNPLWIVVPCHRVIGSNHTLTGYAGGLSMKQTLLKIENPEA